MQLINTDTRIIGTNIDVISISVQPYTKAYTKGITLDEH